ncbi:c-type cytochrome [Flavobacterium sp. MFBS3-15]|uniref:cytochrome c peroxidase n=1 Tax=Flavobacterium sp. MFBS3-15 TaxID=2989816 RepID=UPI002236725E|nr:cytochrome c peroxidase [Flavobacterium sp. MFBS3-15]MCW4470130.1 c-type cytochrome [Flavobacterium sp. MFBS3-15]
MRYFLSLIITLLALTSCKKDNEYTVSVKSTVLAEADSLLTLTKQFSDLAKKSDDTKQLQAKFNECRLQYKKSEWAIEYFIPDVARFINGPALDELELEENREFPPHGFQVIEELLFPEFDPETREELVREINTLASNIMICQKHLDAITMSNDYVMDAAKLQVYRIITLGITGFDSPVAMASIPEAKASLEYLPQLAAMIDTGTNAKAIKDEIAALAKKAAKYCTDNNDFNTFNRAVFISQYLNPVSKKLSELQKAANIPYVNRTNALRTNAETLFSDNAFDVDAFTPSPEYKFTKEKALLGEKLFYDTMLSGDNTRSCASCHRPEKAFSDGLKTNTGLSGNNLKRNTPTLTYASLQHGQFWDLRQPDLEKQSVDVVSNADEMHGSMANIAKKVAASEEYKKLFLSAFGKGEPKEWQIQNAIASYIRTLNKFNSRFDQYMRGDDKALATNEINGLNLFMGKAKCATCHFTPIFNGTVPPSFSKTEHEVVGTPADAKGTKLSEDTGRYIYNQMPQLKNAYKTPGLRNVAKTAPYMHNGVYNTLEEVVDFYNKGGGAGMGLPVDNQTLPFDQLSLTQQEMDDIVAFMKTLTDE